MYRFRLTLEIALLAVHVALFSFKVWDNDKINGSKSTKSKTFVHKSKTQEELKKELDNLNTQIKSGILVIDQEKAHERILYEKYLQNFLDTMVVSQSLVFAKEVLLNKMELDLFNEVSDDIASLGFDFTTNETGITFQGTPANIPNEDLNEMVLDILQSFQENKESWKQQKEKAMAKKFAKRNAIKLGRNLQTEEMNQIINELFSCEMPFASITNKPTAIVIELNELIKRFN